MAVNSLQTNFPGSSNYVSGTQYDAEGRVTQRGLGNGLSSVYDYYDWTTVSTETGYQQGGRLNTLLTASGQNPFQNLAYTYDPEGTSPRSWMPWPRRR